MYSPRDARSFDNFQTPKWLPIDQMLKLNKLGLLKKVIDGRAPEYLITSLDSLRFEHKYIVLYQNKNIIPLTEAQNRRNEEHILLVSIKELNALNLEPTVSFSLMKATLTTPFAVHRKYAFIWVKRRPAARRYIH